MALSEIGDATIPEILQQVQWAGLQGHLDVFNEQTQGAIVLKHDPAWLAMNGGQYREDTRFKTIASLSARTAVGTTATVTSLQLETTKGASVIQAQSLGPVDIADDFILRGKATPAQVAANLGKQFAQAQLEKLRNNIIAVLVAAGTQAHSAAHLVDKGRGAIAGAKVPFTAAYGETMMQCMCDARQQMLAWVMPSYVFSTLSTDLLANYKVDTVAGAIIRRPEVRSFMGLPILVADAPALIMAQTSDYYTEYGVLLLGAGAGTATIVAENPTETERDLTLTSPLTRYRGQYYTEYAVKGAKWDISNGGSNPTAANLVLSTNWDSDGEDHREMPIVMGIFNGPA